MCDLQVEELERRQLLNAACFSPEPLPSQPFAGGVFASREAEPLPRAAFGGYPGPVNPSTAEQGGAEFGSSWGMDRFHFSDRELQTSRPSAPAAQSPDAVRLEASGTEGSQVAAEPVGTTGADGGALPATLDQAGVSRPAATAAAAAIFAAASALPSSAPASRLDIASTGFGARTDVPGLPAARLVARPLEHVEGGSSAVDMLPSTSPTVSPGIAAAPLAAADGERAEEGPGLPPPPGPGLLAGLGTFDPAALERGIQQFLAQLKRTGRHLGGQPDETGLSPWIVAGAVAAAACELARRQLRRTATAWAGSPMAGSPVDQVFAD